MIWYNIIWYKEDKERMTIVRKKIIYMNEWVSECKKWSKIIVILNKKNENALNYEYSLDISDMNMNMKLRLNMKE